MNESERRLMVFEYMKQYGKSLTAQQLETIVQAHQCQSPLFVRTLLEELRVFGVFEQLEQRIEHYLTANTPPALFELVFGRLEQDFEVRLFFFFLSGFGPLRLSFFFFLSLNCRNLRLDSLKRYYHLCMFQEEV